MNFPPFLEKATNAYKLYDICHERPSTWNIAPNNVGTQILESLNSILLIYHSTGLRNNFPNLSKINLLHGGMESAVTEVASWFRTG